ncbi:unnamed protein product [Didymodactylos carnosus]|uniref:Elongator complex protein 5 n=1 Tax=Didymodactylos carnosus TaxID=1234261 RepID=A0A813R3C9_9BILA|nr:unnamed protein product [Didymodactylos carnosus]CAF3560249.1 unnamed protein product [Didymodactylos carnosus]
MQGGYENPSLSSVGFQFSSTYVAEIINKITVIDFFKESNLSKSIASYFANNIVQSTEKCFILIESLPWLLTNSTLGEVCRTLLEYSRANVVMAVLPFDCVNETIMNSFRSIANIIIHVKSLESNSIIQAKIEQKSKTSIETIKVCLMFTIDNHLNAINVREEKISNRKPKTVTSADTTDITTNLTFNLRLKEDEVQARNNLVLPYVKQRTRATDESFTIHYEYDKQDDIDEDDPDDDLTL